MTTQSIDILPRVVVLQMTARRDYAVARAFEKAGMLAAMATDLTVPPWVASKLGGSWSRYTPHLGDAKIISTPITGLLYRAAMRYAGPHAAWPHIWAAKRTARLTIAHLDRQHPDIVFGIDAGAQELFEYFTEASPRPRLVLEQCVAPRKSQLYMLEKLSPYLSEKTQRARKNYILAHRVREEAEWKLADIIICPSDYVKEELIKAGCLAEKIRIVPYGYSPDKNTPSKKKRDRQLPLRGLFVGGLDHRKGIHDLAAVAEQFKNRIHFDVFGKFLVAEDEITEWKKSLTLHGPVPFETVKSAYQNADFLILPSYLEGSAMVVYEAMTYGLPCIVTRETGSIITDGEDGFIINAGDRDGLAATFENILEEPSLLDPISEKARIAAGEVSDETYSERLIAAIVS